MGILTQPQTYDPSENDENNENDKIETEKPIINKNMKKSSRTTYYSDIVGESIKDAVTGATYPWKVGSKEEEKFFRVIITCNPSELIIKGKINNTMGRGVHKAFYDSPKSYMEHHKCVLDDNLIKEWEINHA